MNGGTYHVYTFAQLRHFWLVSGGSPKLANTMASIAQAESGGGLRPHGDVYPGQGTTSWGLWQIHTRDGNACLVNTQVENRPYDEHRLVVDPYYNARAAVRVEESQGLNAWSTYDHGHGPYLAFLRAHQRESHTNSARVSYQTAQHVHASTAHVPPRPHHVAHASHAEGPSLAAFPLAAFTGVMWLCAIGSVIKQRIPVHGRRFA